MVEKEYVFNKDNDGKIRVFAVNCQNPEAMISLVEKIHTPINNSGFLTYLAGDGVNAKRSFTRGEKTVLFHEDLGFAYAEKLKVVKKKYPSITVFDASEIPKD